ncbi:hypothetical protein BH10BAC5_BH10BAC5_17010 [soil metagenome]
MLKRISLLFVALISLLNVTLYSVKESAAFCLSGEYSDIVPTYIPGQMTSYNTRARINWDIKRSIFTNFENQMFITLLTRNIAKERLKTSEFFYFEEVGRASLASVVTGSTQGTAGATKTIVLGTNAAKAFAPFQVYDIVLPNTSPLTLTKEFIVVSVTGTSVVIKPTNSNKGLIACPDGSDVFYKFTSFPRGSDASTPLNYGTEKLPGTTGLFKNSYALDNTLANEDMFGPTERGNQRQITENSHREDLEIAKLFSRELTLADNTDNTTRSMYLGMEQQCLNESPINYIYTGSTWDYSAFLRTQAKFFEQKRVQGVMTHGLSFCNQATTMFYTEEANKKVIVEGFDSMGTYGVEGVMRVRLAGGTLDLKEHYAMTKMYSDINKPAMINTHIRYVETRPYRDTTWEMNIQPKGRDGLHDQVLTEEGFFMAMTREGMHNAVLPN